MIISNDASVYVHNTKHNKFEAKQHTVKCGKTDATMNNKVFRQTLYLWLIALPHSKGLIKINGRLIGQ